MPKWYFSPARKWPAITGRLRRPGWRLWTGLLACVVALAGPAIPGGNHAHSSARPAATAPDQRDDLNALKTLYQRPLFIPFPQDAPYSPQIATLGKMLFFDPRLSGGGNISCASCHNPSFGWEVPLPTALGAANTQLPRHAPTIINAAWVAPFFWDGRAATLEEQAAGPITAPEEMNSSLEAIVERLSEVRDYAEWFDRLFPGQGLTPDTILRSIATYERTIVAGWSDFDRWVDGDETAISAAAVRGFELFNGDAGCANCHSGWNFTDNNFHRIGLPSDDLGAGGLPDATPDDAYRFKTQGLRNIALRAPYMHNGSLSDLPAVIRHYADAPPLINGLDTDLIPFAVTDRDVADLTAFLLTLSDDNGEVPTPILPAN